MTPRRSTATCPALHTGHATYAAVQRQGTRAVQADGYAVFRDPVTGRVATAVADGIGDTPVAA